MEPMEPMTPIDEDLPLDPDKYSHDEDWGAEPMDAVSAYPADMIPRVTIRDADDALTILMEDGKNERSGTGHGQSGGGVAGG